MVWRSRRIGVRAGIPVKKPFIKKSRAVFLGLTAFVIAIGTLYIPSSPNADAALPGTDWTQRSPSAVVKFWTDIASSADGTKLAVIGGDDFIYTSTDSGGTWTRRDPSGTNTFKRWSAIASSSDGTRLVAVAQNDFVYTSDNSGQSWTMRQPDGGNAKIWYSAASSSDGMTLMVGAGVDYVYISTDGGANWTPSYPFGAATRTWSAMAMSSDASMMFVGNDAGYIYRSINGGTSWSQLDPAGAPRYWAAISASADGTRLVAVARNDYVYTSINSGANWTQNVVGGSTQYWASAGISANGNVMMVGSGNGNVYVSTDVATGPTWTMRDPAGGGNKNWAGIALSADGTKAAVSAITDYIYTSTDTGTTWTQRDPVGSARYWTSLASSADGMTLFAGAQSDYLYKSTDGGDTWSAPIRPGANVTRAWAGLAMSTDGTRIVGVEGTGSGGMIWTSADGGSTWTQRNPLGGGSRNWWSVACSADCRSIVATTTGDYVYTSTDFGDNWTLRQPAGPGAVYSWYGSAMTADGSKIVIASGGGPNYLYISNDGGANWTQLTSSPGAGSWNKVVMSADGQRIMAAAGGNYIWISADGGTTWTERRPGGTGVTGNWTGMATSANGMRLLVANPSGWVYTSVDGGLTWTQRDPAGGTRNWRAAASSANGARLVVAAINDYIYTSGGSFLPTVDPPEISVMGGTVSLIGECSVTNDYSFTDVVSKGDSAHAISYDGVVYSWGDNTYGQFGNGTTTASDVPMSVDVTGVLAGKTITKIVRTESAVLALGADGSVYAWGDNTYGQLGNGNNTSSTVPVAVTTSGVLSGKMVLQLIVAGETVYVLTSDGSVYAWGDNTYGQLGNGTTTASNVPVAVNTSGVLSGKTIRQISATEDTAYALASDGSVYSWGRNDRGQLGNGGVTISPTWTQRDPSGTGTIKYYHSAAMSADGNTIAVVAQYSTDSVYVSTDGGVTWTARGASAGLPAALAYSDIKMSADGQTMILTVQANYVYTSTNGGATWTQRTPAGAGATRTWRVAAISPDGATMAVAAGNDYVYTSTNGGVSWTPRDPAGATRDWYGLAMSADGTKMWAGAAGGLVYFSINGGANWTANSPRPSNGGIASWGRIAMSADGSRVITGSRDNSFEGWVYTTTNAGTASPATWTQRDPTGTGFKSWFGVASSTDGTRLMAGMDGGLGPVYTSVDGGVSWTGQSSLPNGYWRGLAMSSNGEKMVAANFGQATSGDFVYTYPTITGGGGVNADSPLPVAVDMTGVLSGKTISSISTGYQTAYAIAADGSVYSWGNGTDGQLGNGASVDSNIPVAVTMSGAMGGKIARQIVGDDGYVFAIASDGTVYAWGSGPLGNGNSSDVPVAVTGSLSGKNISTIISNGMSVYALARDGTMHAWGANGYGQLGNSNNTPQSTPVAVYMAGVMSSKFAVGMAASDAPAAYGLTSDGMLYSWGYNGYGQLGNGTNNDSNAPTAVTQSSPIASITINGKPVTDIISGDGCTVTFTAPSNDPGTYDVVVTYSDGTVMTIPQSLTYIDLYIMLFLYGDNVINASPFTNNGEGTTPLQTTVVTNDTTGYTVSLNSVGTTNLACSESGRGGDLVPAMSGSGSSMTNDTWAYGLGTSVATPTTWNGTTTTPAVFDSYGADTAGRTHFLYFGAKVTLNTTPCSSYQGDVILTAISNWGTGP
ncbi:hypothetical protein FWG95_01460 [Candidatus Saccharibacteria bacterium]|nr:hypothetical protein [Candidatus Saccharibacteria bacterium]